MVVKLQLNFDKNLIGNIVILLSLILLIVCIAMQANLMMDTFLHSGEFVEWNGNKYSPPPDVKAEVTQDTLKFDSPYDSHDLELKKTKDQTNFNKYIAGDDVTASIQTPYNTTHTLILNEGKKFGAIVANDEFENTDDGTIKLKGNPEIIELTFKNADLSFILSVTNPVQDLGG